MTSCKYRMYMALKTCSRGHRYERSSDCPVCPKCWPGYYKKMKTDLPEGLSAPAIRGLLGAKITSLKHLARHTQAEILALHGVGPSAIPKLRNALKKRGLAFRA